MSRFFAASDSESSEEEVDSEPEIRTTSKAQPSAFAVS
jgi:hypothetical protein